MGANKCDKGCHRLLVVPDRVSTSPSSQDKLILGGKFSGCFVAACFLAYSLPFLNISCLFSVKIGADEGFLKTGQNPLLTIFSAGHALHVFINGQLAGG